jgi:hypothetical protein
MYMGVVYGWHTIWHMMHLVDVLFMILYFIVDIYFSSLCMGWYEFDAWAGPRIIIERAIDLCSS